MVIRTVCEAVHVFLYAHSTFRSVDITISGLTLSRNDCFGTYSHLKAAPSPPS